MTKTDRITRAIQNDLERARAAIAKFGDNLSVNPAYAFEWGMAAIDAAGVIEVYSRAQLAIEAGQPLADLRAELSKNVFFAARNPERSTSTTSNLIAQAKLSATAALVELLGAE